MELWVGMKILRHTYLAYVVKSNPGPHRRKVSYSQIKTVQVCGSWLKYTLWFGLISSFFKTWLAYFFLMSLPVLIHFFQCFWNLHVSLFFLYFGTIMCPILFFSILFAQPCCLFLKICQRDHILEHGVFILLVMKNMFQRIPSVGIAYYLWCVREF